MNKNQLAGLKKQAGISLPDMLIATVIAGLLAALAYGQFGNASSGVRAKTTYDAAQKLSSSWSMLVQQTGIPMTTTSSPLVASGNTALDAIMVGNSPTGIVVTTYANAYQQSGIKPLSNMAVITTSPAVGSAGAYTINGYPVSLTSATVNGQTVLNVVFTTVPSDVVQAVYSSHANVAATPFNASSAITTGHVQYSVAATDGTMTLTLQINP